ncbi:MAG: winged helix-turn-helix domain-containing protein [Eubacteriales bacterium]|nr:winged helix-turn-helix domain-containing protein [Eubacteriales bacterium]
MQKPEKKLQGTVITLQSDELSVKVNHKTIALTQQEYLLLETLATNPGEIFSRDRLMLLAWHSCPLETRTIDMHVARLRKKLGKETVKTIRGEGYCLREAACAIS